MRARTLNRTAFPRGRLWPSHGMSFFIPGVLITELQIDHLFIMDGGSCIICVCTVLQDEASILQETPISIENLIGADMQVAASYASNAGLDVSVLQKRAWWIKCNVLWVRSESARTQALLATTQTTLYTAMGKANEVNSMFRSGTAGSSAQNGATNLLRVLQTRWPNCAH